VRRLHVEALVYCISWAALAILGLNLAGIKAGLLLSVGLFIVVMPTSALVLSRTGNFALERGVRWGILVISALILLSVADTAP
jgi:hypothetical protein